MGVNKETVQFFKRDFEENSLMKRVAIFLNLVLYFVYGLKNSVQICIWLTLVLLTGVPHLRETGIPPQGGKSGWAGPPSPCIGPQFRLLKTIAEAQNLIPEFETPGSKVLYLGAASGTTMSHVSDIVGPCFFCFLPLLVLRPDVLRWQSVH